MLQAMLLSDPVITIADLQIDDDEDEDEDYLMLLRMYAMDIIAVLIDLLKADHAQVCFQCEPRHYEQSR